MDEASFFQRCKDLAGVMSDDAWTRENMAGFFQNFRPDEQQLGPLFEDLPAGAEVFKRLQQVYRATACTFTGRQGADLYFIVRRPEPTTNDQLMRFATAQLSNWRNMAAAINEHELVDLLTPIPLITIRDGSPTAPNPHDTESLDAYIYDVQTDWHAQLAPLCPHASWMRDAFYYLACDYYLARFITWPWYMHSSSLNDPYEPYFYLWLHGAELRCESRERVTLFVSAYKDAT